MPKRKSTPPKILLIEWFHSIQGEGRYTGTPMFFIRLPYCNIQCNGICTTWDKREFVCDTDLSQSREVSVERLMEEVEEYHICVTGGEPFHPKNLEAINLIARHMPDDAALHFETNGTFPIPGWACGWYIACSPKKGYNFNNTKHINEFRLIVDNDFRVDDVPKAITQSNTIWLSPVSVEGRIDPMLIKQCLGILREHPNWHLSVQMHKYLEVR